MRCIGVALQNVITIRHHGATAVHGPVSFPSRLKRVDHWSVLHLVEDRPSHPVR
jgi:hypothetical protein